MQSVKEVILTSTNTSGTWTATVYNYITGSVIATHKKPNVSYRHLQIINDTYLIATDTKNPYLYYWSLHKPSHTQHQRLITPGIVTALSCTPDGSYIVLAVDEKIFIYQASTGQLLQTLSRHYQAVTNICFNSDGSSFATCGDDGFVFLWCLTDVINNYNQAAPYREFSDHTLPVKSIYLGNFGIMSRLVTVSLDKTARIYNASTGDCLATLIFDTALMSVCLDSNESNLFIGCSNGIIKYLNLRCLPRDLNVDIENNSVSLQGHSNQVTHLSISVDCMTLISGDVDGKINIWDIPSRQIVRSIMCQSPVLTATLIPNFSNSTSELNCKYTIPPFERPNHEKKNNVIQISTSKNDDFLLNEDLYLRNNNQSRRCNSNSSSRVFRKNIIATEKMEKINSELYQYMIQYLIDNDKR
ncbi:WD repeat-containing protein 18 [Chelonus insularis]|uniref:WD repeat-containing protein 18 n=1 Tax=Chelonus insularis TaxID=460826 RepID=UPI00158C368C|nr:WD repeat-containing protein 18 [Chelonus insularis]